MGILHANMALVGCIKFMVVISLCFWFENCALSLEEGPYVLQINAHICATDLELYRDVCIIVFVVCFYVVITCSWSFCFENCAFRYKMN